MGRRPVIHAGPVSNTAHQKQVGLHHPGEINNVGSTSPLQEFLRGVQREGCSAKVAPPQPTQELLLRELVEQLQQLQRGVPQT